MDLIAAIRDEVAPGLRDLDAIEDEAAGDQEVLLKLIARFVAGLIRDGASCSELAAIRAELASANTKLEHIMTTQSENQAQIDTDVAGIEGALATISTAEQANGTAVAAVAAALAAFQASQTPDNLAALDQAVTDAQTAAASVSAGVTAVQGLVPATPAAPSGGAPVSGVSN